MSIDDFLAAPDSVRENEDERRRAIERKAHLAAEEKRLENSKREGEPTVEELCADLIRIAESEQLNPLGWKDKALSRKRYKRLGHWYIEHVERQFGTFQHALEVAGLRDQAGTRKWKYARAESSRREHAARYQERYMHPYVYDPARRTTTETDLILSISDTHATFLDPWTWHCFLRACEYLEPDIVLLNGDILEGSEISRYPKIPGWTVPLQLEFDFARSMFEQVRHILPDAEIIWLSGNHGLDRIASYLTQVAPALSGLRCLRFDQLAGLDDLGVKLSQGGTIASPAGAEDEKRGVLFHKHYLAYHGLSTGVTPYVQEFRQHGFSGQSGHIHRAGLMYATTEAGGARTWMSTPMGCTWKAGRSYMKGRHSGTQQGFGIAFVDPGGRTHQYPVVTSEGFCAFEGLTLRDPGLPEADVKRNWLPDFWEASGFAA